MAYDGKVLRRALDRLERLRTERQAALDHRRAEIYARIPRIAEIDTLLKNTFIEIITAALHTGSNPVPAIHTLRDQNLELQAERAELLVVHGYPMDAADEVPLCPICKDTGYQGPALCRCLKKLYHEEQTKELSNLLNLGEQNFDRFELHHYSTDPWPGERVSPRENMELVRDLCWDYANKFGKYYFNNLFLTGSTGLGKTFLSACIARTVSEKGFSVVYDTAPHIFAQFESQKFSRDPEDTRDAKDETRRYLFCDLLIIDDLGAEMVTPFVQATLYHLINTRLIADKKTIINSNLSIAELRQRYTPQIASRVEGEYRALPFFGEDIRVMRKRRF